MRVLIVEEGLEGLHGHYFQYLRDMVEAGRRAGHVIEVLAHVNACDEIKTVLGAKPVLRRSVIGRSAPRSPLERLRAVITHNRSLREDVLRWAEQAEIPYDVTIFTSVRIDHLWALHTMQKIDEGRRLGHIVAILLDAAGRRLVEGGYIYPRSAWPLRLLLRWVAGTPRRAGLSFAAESAGMARLFENCSGRRFGYVPHVTEMPANIVWRGRQGTTPTDPLVLGTFGFTRFDKGLDVLQEAIKRLTLPERAHFQFVLQWTGDYRLPDGGLVTQDPELTDDENVIFLPSFSRSEDYHEWLGRIDAVVLPYREEFYRDRLSRVAIDAALVGLPVVYPRRTWLESFFSDYGAGVAFDAEDAASLTAAIQILKRDFSQLVKQSEARIERTRQDFSGEEFFSCIARLITSSNDPG